MTDRPDPPRRPDLDALAAMVGLALRPEWHASISANLEISLRLAAQVAAFPLEDEADLAPVFQP